MRSRFDSLFEPSDSLSFEEAKDFLRKIKTYDVYVNVRRRIRPEVNMQLNLHGLYGNPDDIFLRQFDFDKLKELLELKEYSTIKTEEEYPLFTKFALAFSDIFGIIGKLIYKDFEIKKELNTSYTIRDKEGSFIGLVFPYRGAFSTTSKRGAELSIQLLDNLQELERKIENPMLRY